MPSDLNQTLYLKGLPDGLTFTIVEIKPTIPNGSGWLAGFRHPDAGSITAGPYVRTSLLAPRRSIRLLST